MTSVTTSMDFRLGWGDVSPPDIESCLPRLNKTSALCPFSCQSACSTQSAEWRAVCVCCGPSLFPGLSPSCLLWSVSNRTKKALQQTLWALSSEVLLLRMSTPPFFPGSKYFHKSFCRNSLNHKFLVSLWALFVFSRRVTCLLRKDHRRFLPIASLRPLSTV